MVLATPRRRSAYRVRVQFPRSSSKERGWIRRLSGACLRHPGVTTAAIVSSVLGVGLGALGPLLTRIVVDDAVAGSTPCWSPSSSGSSRSPS